MSQSMTSGGSKEACYVEKREQQLTQTPLQAWCLPVRPVDASCMELPKNFILGVFDRSCLLCFLTPPFTSSVWLLSVHLTVWNLDFGVSRFVGTEKVGSCSPLSDTSSAARSGFRRWPWLHDHADLVMASIMTTLFYHGNAHTYLCHEKHYHLVDH